MDLLRRHLFSIICGAAAAAGIALIVTGTRATPRVQAGMEQSRRLYEELKSLQSDPVNQAIIDAEERRIALTLEDRDKVVEATKELYGYEPLVAEALPNGNDNTRRTFRSIYDAAMDKLMESLHSGQPATEADINLMREKIQNERYMAEDEDLAGDAPVFDMSGPERTAAGVLTMAGARGDPVARADLAKAQRMQCYAVDFRRAKPPRTFASLEFDVTMLDLGDVDAPAPGDVWRAQVSYWIQKDVVGAIAAVNNTAATAAKARGEDSWVGTLPVKDVISIRVSEDYVLPEAGEYAGAAPGGYAEALPSGTGVTVFTGSESTELYEVRQFTLKLVMDQRDIPLLVDRICRDRFHTPLRIAYEALPPNKDMRGKIYGSEPVVNVVMDFETIMLGEVFRPLMPTEVCELLADEGYGIECPELDEDQEDEG